MNATPDRNRFHDLVKNKGQGAHEIAYAEGVTPWDDERPNPFLQRAVEAAINLTHVATMTVIDVGCGYGHNVEAISKLGFKSVIGIDISETAIAKAKQRHPDYADRFQQQDLLDPEFTADADLVTEIYTLQVMNPETRAAALAALPKLLKPGGKLVIIARYRSEDTEPNNKPPFPITESELQVLEAHGMQRVHFEQLTDDTETPHVERLIAVYEKLAANP